jgi:hypothetical protein
MTLQLPFRTGARQPALTSNFPSELATPISRQPPTSLQNWLTTPSLTSNFPSELAQDDRSASSNFPSELARHDWNASNFPSELASARHGIPPTSLQNWRELCSTNLQLPFRTGHSLFNCIKIKGISALSTLSPDA